MKGLGFRVIPAERLANHYSHSLMTLLDKCDRRAAASGFGLMFRVYGFGFKYNRRLVVV